MAGFSPNEIKAMREYRLETLLKDQQNGGGNISNNNNNNGFLGENANESTYNNGKGINISFNLNRFMEFLFINHFTATICMLFFGAIFYLIVNNNININNLLLNTNIFVSSHYYYIIIAIAIIAILAILVVLCKRINVIIRAHEINKIFSEALVNQFNALKNELADLKSSLEILYNNYNNVNISIGTLTQLISDDVLNTKKIVSILHNINNTVKKIPNKETIIDMLTIRTKLLFSDTIEIVSEYLTFVIAKQPLTQIGNGNNNIFNINSNQVNNKSNKNTFIEEKLHHKIDNIKQQYIVEVFQLSKNTIDNKIRGEINDMLDSAFNNILFLTLNPEQQNTLDQLLYNIDHCVKQLTANLIALYSENLLLTSFFDE